MDQCADRRARQEESKWIILPHRLMFECRTLPRIRTGAQKEFSRIARYVVSIGRAGLPPQPIHLTPSTTVSRLADVIAFVESRAPRT